MTRGHAVGWSPRRAAAGKERANAEYGGLLAAAGLALGRVTPAAFPYGAIEATRP